MCITLFFNNPFTNVKIIGKSSLLLLETFLKRGDCGYFLSLPATSSCNDIIVSCLANCHRLDVVKFTFFIVSVAQTMK